ncbi:dsrm domain containing protein [Trichuris trichiura]|uniref:Dsrm domain containing protein n=1 Tax=Trichuris trichiura TaxID=36087 RepID=A0A077ZCW3_TRITR|nr:dsrm domain containing protein [Trichuris trichiura]
MASQENILNLLNEYCMRYRMRAVFDLLNTTGPAHCPVFTIRVTVGSDYTAVGKGCTKQSARLDAVANMLEQIVQDEKHLQWGLPVGREEALQTINNCRAKGKSESCVLQVDPVPVKESHQLANAQSQLHSLFAQKGKKCPRYVDTSDSGAPGFCTIKVVLDNGVTAVGVARSKKSAKQLAAFNALKKLNEMQNDCSSSDVKNATYTITEEANEEANMDTAENEACDDFGDDISNRFDLNDIPMEHEDNDEKLFYEESNSDHLNLLCAMCEQKGWAYNFTEPAQPENAESVDKMVFLCLPEDQVFGGIGKDVESAKWHAAHVALMYFHLIGCETKQ